MPAIEDYNFDKTQYNFFGAYRNTKRANVLFTYALQRRLEVVNIISFVIDLTLTQGTGVIANCLCPGYARNTGLARHAGGQGDRSAINSITSDPSIQYV